jgi:hypothetical protein
MIFAPTCGGSVDVDHGRESQDQARLTRSKVMALFDAREARDSLVLLITRFLRFR